MAAVRRRERITAAGIVATAAVLALIILKDSPTPPPPVEPPAQPSAEIAEALAAVALMGPIEVVELPPAPASAAPPTPVAEPSPPPVAAPPPPVPAPPIAMEPPEPPKETPAEISKPSLAQVAPDPPPITPLRPAPEPTKAIAPIQPLKPELLIATPAPLPPKEIVPLKPAVAEEEADLPPREPLVPLKVEEQDLARLRSARAQPKEIAPMRPTEPAPPPAEVTPLQPTKPEPVPAKVPESRAVAAVSPPPVAKALPPAPKPKPAPPPVELKPPPAITSGTVGEGRALLRLLEEGSGPSIQIGWPAQPGARDSLYRTFMQCFGMRVALLDASGRLFVSEGTAGAPTEFDPERYSGFVRRPEGAMAADEQREVAHLSARHHTDAGPVRVFPRQVDAYLMSSLRQAVGDNYLSAKAIRARYRINNGHVIVEGITADGREVNGTIDLAAVAQGCGG